MLTTTTTTTRKSCISHQHIGNILKNITIIDILKNINIDILKTIHHLSIFFTTILFFFARFNFHDTTPRVFLPVLMPTTRLYDDDNYYDAIRLIIINKPFPLYTTASFITTQGDADQRPRPSGFKRHPLYSTDLCCTFVYCHLF